MRYAKASVICTLLSVPTLFLMITIIVFPAIGFLLGIMSFRQHMREHPDPRDRRPLAAAGPMMFAVVVCVLEVWLVNSTFRA